MSAGSGKCGTNTGRDALGRFGKGNPGKPRGTRHKATQAALALLDGEAEALSRKAVEKALGGDVAALRLCLERVAPPLREAPVAFPLPRIRGAADAPEAMASLIAAVAEGDLTPVEAERIAKLVDIFRRTLETADLEARVAFLEGQSEGKGQ